MYKNALQSVLQLNNIDEHVKNYRPQLLVLSGMPNSRPILIDFANLLTRNLSLMICGHVVETELTYAERIGLEKKSRDWLKKHNIKAFYALADGESFRIGSTALMEAVGIGKLRPNIILMGYKCNWQTCTNDELQSYFQTIHKVNDAIVFLNDFFF